MKYTPIIVLTMLLTATGVSVLYFSDYQLDSLWTNPESKTSLTSDEAISIAMQDPAVAMFMRQNTIFPHADFDDGLWMVRFVDVSNPNNYVEVTVNDDDKSVQSDGNFAESGYQNIISEGSFAGAPSDADYRAESGIVAEPVSYNMKCFYNPLLIEAAIEYFTSHTILDDFDIDSMYWYGYSWDEQEVSLWGYDELVFDTWISADITATSIGDEEWSFTLNEMTSSVVLGDTRLDFEIAKEIAESSSQFTDFVNQYENYTSYVTLHWYSDTYPILQGYYFNIQYNPQYYYYRYDDIATGYVDSGVSEEHPALLLNDDENKTDPSAPSAEPYYEYTWLEFVVSDKTSQIIEVWGPKSALMSVQDVMDIILSLSEIDDWIGTVGNYNNYSYYDGYGNWWTYLSDQDDNYNYAYVNLNDRTGEVTDIEIYLSTPASMSEQDIKSILASLTETKEFFDTVIKYEVDLWYDHYGKWYFYVYDLDDYHNYFYGQIDDNTKSILTLDLYLYQPPKLTEDDVLLLVEETELKEFINHYADVVQWAWYDGYGTWYLYAYSATIIEAWFWVSVNDISGEILLVESHEPTKLPDLTVSEIKNIVRHTSNYSDFVRDTKEYFEYYYYYDGKWYYSINGYDNDGHYSFLSFEIDDTTGEILQMYYYSWVYLEKTEHHDEDLMITENTVEATKNP
ncbi:MAG: hypothetical protein ACW98K_01310 [Candidatus Kariarchaeaceae archaeon]